jgi:hypothetical protein
MSIRVAGYDPSIQPSHSPILIHQGDEYRLATITGAPIRHATAMMLKGLDLVHSGKIQLPKNPRGHNYHGDGSPLWFIYDDKGPLVVTAYYKKPVVSAEEMPDGLLAWRARPDMTGTAGTWYFCKVDANTPGAKLPFQEAFFVNRGADFFVDQRIPNHRWYAKATARYVAKEVGTQAHAAFGHGLAVVGGAAVLYSLQHASAIIETVGRYYHLLHH